MDHKKNYIYLMMTKNWILTMVFEHVKRSMSKESHCGGHIFLSRYFLMVGLFCMLCTF